MIYFAYVAPSFVALIAQEEDLDQDGNQKTPPGFLVMHLPFHDDIREVPIDFPHVEVNEDQLTAAKALIKKMKLRRLLKSSLHNLMTIRSIRISMKKHQRRKSGSKTLNTF